MEFILSKDQISNADEMISLSHLNGCLNPMEDLAEDTLWNFNHTGTASHLLYSVAASETVAGARQKESGARGAGLSWQHDPVRCVPLWKA